MNRPTDPPKNALQWLAQWRYAAEQLPKIRARELRELSDEDAIQALGTLDVASESESENPWSNGLVIQQAWFSRLRILQLQAKQQK